jgi:hypothetical protein
MSDRLNWYNSIDDVKPRPIKFWRYVSSLRNTILVAEAFAKHFQSVCNTSPVSHHSSLLSSDFLQMLPVSELDILKAIKRLRPCKSVGLCGISGFIITGCSTIFAPLLKHIFSISLSRERFPTQ